jgi:type IV pilus assembly protein PilV
MLIGRLPRRHSRRHAGRAECGFALLEVLVSLVILLLGLLGLVGVSSRANISELEAYQRVQALQLVQDMADRINANRMVASCYSNGTAGVKLGTGITVIPACTMGTPQQQARAVADLTEWNGLLQGSAVADTQNPKSNPGGLIGALGCVTQSDPTNNVYLIAVAWQGMAETAAPLMADGTTPFPCGSATNFGKETLHRVVSTKVQIGNLGSTTGAPGS